MTLLILWVLAGPILAFCILAVTTLLGQPLAEHRSALVVRVAFFSAFLAAFGVMLSMVLTGVRSEVIHLGDWFGVEGHHLELSLVVDRLSVPFTLLTTALSGVIGAFASRYLHRESGFNRFFMLLMLFATGMLGVVLAGSLDVLYAGWELLGLSSAMLIGFFHERRNPVLNAVRAFVTYRVCDVGLLAGAVLMHHAVGTSAFDQIYSGSAWPDVHADLPDGEATVIAGLLIFASLGKSAQVPLSGWFPRAMEGPTPSSAIFYGALSVHAGAYLLLRNGALIAQVPAAQVALIVIGLTTAVHATLVGRVQSDIKSSLAYASVTQVGLILAEIGFGFRQLAVAHIVGHALIRALQLLRAPSALRDRNQLEAAVGGHLNPTGAWYSRILPASLRSWLYRLALERGYHDALLELIVVGPVLALLRSADRLEQQWIAWLAGSEEQR